MSSNDRGLTGADTLANAIRTVEYTMQLQLPADRWELVAGIIEAAINAAVAGDLEALRKATDELLRALPARVIRADGSQSAAADPKVFERANELVHVLQSMQPATAEEDSDS
jgi:hypothetical protein